MDFQASQSNSVAMVAVVAKVAMVAIVAMVAMVQPSLAACDDVDEDVQHVDS